MKSHSFAVLVLLAAPMLRWEAIQPVSKEVQIDNAATGAVTLPILGANGNPLYTLSCYGQNAQPNATDFKYDGEFECRLTEAGARRSRHSTLLTENPGQSRDSESRARFFGSELEGACAEVPEFGRERTFLLRGMRLTLRMSQVSFTPSRQLKSFALAISADNDAEPAAQGDIASAPKIARRWASTRCKLNNSVTPHFTSR